MATGTVKWFNGLKRVLDSFSRTTAARMCSFTSAPLSAPVLPDWLKVQKVEFKLKTDKMRGKVSAENLSLA